MMTPRTALPLCAASLVALAAACSKTPEPAPSAAPERAAPAAPTSTGAAPAAAAAPKGPSEIAWDVPAGFESAPNPNAMRKATYKVKRADGDTEDAEMSVSQAGGSVDANVQRWSGQFEKTGAEAEKRTERKVGDLKVTVVEVHGTFAGGGMPGMPGGTSKPGYALLGAIVDTGGGGPLWFFKLTGPKKTVVAAKGGFDKLVDSLRPK